jgi:hypothetical protein
MHSHLYFTPKLSSGTHSELLRLRDTFQNKIKKNILVWSGLETRTFAVLAKVWNQVYLICFKVLKLCRPRLNASSAFHPRPFRYTFRGNGARTSCFINAYATTSLVKKSEMRHWMVLQVLLLLALYVWRDDIFSLAGPYVAKVTNPGCTGTITLGAGKNSREGDRTSCYFFFLPRPSPVSPDPLKRHWNIFKHQRI